MCRIPTYLGRLLGLGVVGLALTPGFAQTADSAGEDGAAPKTAPAPKEENSEPPQDPMQRIGSISIGKPHTGYLVNGVKMPNGKAWVLSIPSHAWGTDETVDALVHCLEKVHREIPNTPPAIIGSLSAKGGGPLPPHKSHRSGRDVDIHFYLTKRTPKKWYERATAENLDRLRTWALLRTIITETDVEMILIDQSVKDLLEEHALSIGEDPQWIEDLFHNLRPYSALIKHVPGHTGHMHVRFVSPYARRRGVELYDQLVEQGHIQPPHQEVTHEVVKGDTLIGIAQRYKTKVDSIRQLNELETTVIKIGQKLTIEERQDIPGARARVVVPPRRLPPKPKATTAKSDENQAAKDGDAPPPSDNSEQHAPAT